MDITRFEREMKSKTPLDLKRLHSALGVVEEIFPNAIFHLLWLGTYKKSVENILKKKKNG